MPRPGLVKELGMFREHRARGSSVAMLTTGHVSRTVAPEELRPLYLRFNRPLAKTDSVEGHK